MSTICNPIDGDTWPEIEDDPWQDIGGEGIMRRGLLAVALCLALVCGCCEPKTLPFHRGQQVRIKANGATGTVRNVYAFAGGCKVVYADKIGYVHATEFLFDEIEPAAEAE